MGLRRSNGSGTVYKKKDRARRKPYCAVVTLNLDSITGRQTRKTLGYFATQKEAWAALNAYNNDPKFYMAKDITFGEVWDMMIAQKENMGVSSAANYNMTKNRCDHIWNRPIQDVKLIHLQDIVDSSGLSAASKRQIKVTLNAVFTLAFENDFVLKNYAELIKLPALGQSDKHKPLSTEDMHILWQHTDDEMVQMALVYCYTGARPIELLQMKVDNVNLKEKYMVGGVKTAAGKDRHIPIADCIYPFVSEFYKKNAFSRGYLFPVTASSSLRYRIKQMINKYGLENHIPHDFRHTFITLADNYQVNELVVKMIVGHSRGRDITQGVYTHKTHQQLLDAVNALPYGTEMSMISQNLVGAIKA